MIILMGVAGAGKSMQGKILADEQGHAWISTGEVLRVLVTGKRRQDMQQGKLLSDSEVIAVVEKVMELIDTSQEFVMDGFPRTQVQVDWLLNQIAMGRLKKPIVFNLEIDEAVIRDRIKKRDRPDDTEETIALRFKEYDRVTRPIIAYMRKKGINVIDIDADQTPRKVHDQINSYLENHTV
jgi:adenylate kinase